MRLLGAGDLERLGDLAPQLSGEIEKAFGFSPVAAAFSAGVPVSFAYAVYETEKLWDVSIDTLEPYRGRGLASACVEFLIGHMARRGKEAVWGPSSPTSLRSGWRGSSVSRSWTSWPSSSHPRETCPDRRGRPTARPAAHLLAAGYVIRTIQELFGYNDIKNTMIYTHVLTGQAAGAF